MVMVPVKSPVAVVTPPTVTKAERPATVWVPPVVGTISTKVLSPVALTQAATSKLLATPKLPVPVTACPLTVPVQSAVPVRPLEMVTACCVSGVNGGSTATVTVMVQSRSATGSSALAGAAGTRSTPVARTSNERYRTGRRGRRSMFPPAGWAARTDLSRNRQGGYRWYVGVADPTGRSGMHEKLQTIRSLVITASQQALRQCFLAERDRVPPCPYGPERCAGEPGGGPPESDHDHRAGRLRPVPVGQGANAVANLDGGDQDKRGREHPVRPDPQQYQQPEAERQRPRRHPRAVEVYADIDGSTGRLSRALHAVTGCVKTYVAQFAEGQGFEHVHFHVVPRMVDLPDGAKGPLSPSVLGEDVTARFRH